MTQQKAAISGCHTQQNSVAFICKGKFSCETDPKLVRLVLNLKRFLRASALK